MEFDVIHHIEWIEIFPRNEHEWRLIIKRNNTWRGKLIGKVFKDDTLIFEYGESSAFFRTKISILYQKLDFEVTLDKRRGRYCFAYNNCLLEVRLQYFKKTSHIFTRNDIQIGEAQSQNPVISLPPEHYKVFLTDYEDEYLYVLIFFSMQLGPFFV
jgi:hypothetical protein